MKVSDYIVQFMEKNDIHYVFGYPGGPITHVLDSLSKSKIVKTFISYHEQGAAFEACGYAQSSGKVGAVVVSSGPGATNLLTGLCNAFYDSIPILFITGQVNTYEGRGDLPIRQKGFQEHDIVSMVKGVTKYAKHVNNSNDIPKELETALRIAKEGRMGPVLLDLPMNVTREDINGEPNLVLSNTLDSEIDYEELMVVEDKLRSAKQPVLLLGNGINIANVKEEINSLLEGINIPIVTSMLAVDLMDCSDYRNFGFIGAYGMRQANFIISQSDLIISIGSRVDCRQTGANKEGFGPNACLVRFDIDKTEFSSKIKDNEIDIQLDIRSSIDIITSMIKNNYIVNEKWINKCNYYREKLKNLDDLLVSDFVKKISNIIPDGTTITTDVGQNQIWIAQYFQQKRTQRILFSGGYGAMGYSLPAAIGAYYSTHRPVYCFSGDGGFQMNIQELQFIVREKLPIKIILFNNASLGMIRHFQEMYFNENYSYTTNETGVKMPDFTKIVEAYGIKSYKISKPEDISGFRDELCNNEPVFLQIMLEKKTYIYPKLAYDKPLYDQEPLMNRELLNELLEFEG